MPESVTDRPTKSHEYIFLLTKSAKYYYDADAVRVPLSAATLREMQEGYNGKGRKGYEGTGAQNPSETKSRIIKNLQAKGQTVHTMHVNRENGEGEPALNSLGANLKSVWHIPTQPFPGAHFATFPERIPELCIKAGSRPGDIVLDPFAGSGTTPEVAKRLGRDFIAIDISEKYMEGLVIPRVSEVNPLFQEREK
jgi:site-specific DNA-methyltransferase (cytosine-N4-specific)